MYLHRCVCVASKAYLNKFGGLQILIDDKIE